MIENIIQKEMKKVIEAKEYIWKPPAKRTNNNQREEQAMEQDSSNIHKMTVLKPKHNQPFLSPNNASMCNKKKQSSRRTSPNAHGQMAIISLDIHPHSSGSNQKEISNNEEGDIIPL